ncbi:peptide ABC transporter substrate-binding protein [Paenibacillus humicola]|uniref:peptide ABC transporter substrate-binding protein n=1 Tax=Paenibacillus humicola TaxID=3110540 RepID=UPI00237ADCD2|nr:peptide ABC transporter substrate-binding protein [Paenibacillus humicola]
MLSRKMTALSLTAVMLTAGLLSGCSPKQAGDRSVVTVAEPAMTSLDPHAWQAQILVDQGTILEGLVGYDTNLNLVPKVAERWTESKDGLTWTFYLRKDAKWSNGEPVTAKDFYYAWMRFMGPENTQAPTWESFMQFVVNGSNYHNGAVPADQVGLKVVNPYEIRITLARPHPSLLGWFALSSSMPLYQPVVDKHPNDWFMPQYFVGNGPYVVRKFVPNGTLDLVRNEKYAGNPSGFNVGNVKEIKIIPTPSTPVQTYMAGQLDMAPISNPSDYVFLRKKMPDVVHETPNFQVQGLTFDKALEKSPLDDERVRKAIAMVIDRSIIANKVMNGMVLPTDVFGPPDWPSAKFQKGIPRDVDQAKKLLADAGYPGGKGMPTIHIYTPAVGDPQVLAAVSAADQLKNTLGINAVIEPTTGSLFGDIIWGGYHQDVKPGFFMSNGVVNWWDSSNMDLQTFEAYAYSLPPEWRQYVAKASIATNNPYSVTKYGSPDDEKKGIQEADWKPLQDAFEKDNAFLVQYAASQTDPAYRDSLTPLPSNAEVWQGYLDAWKNAKTDKDKHTAWVNAWNFIGNATGLDMQVWQDQHRPDYAKQWNILSARQAASDLDKAPEIAGQLAQSIIDSGWAVPLYAPKDIYITRPWISNVVFNKFSFGNFFQLQYLTVKDDAAAAKGK